MNDFLILYQKEIIKGLGVCVTFLTTIFVGNLLLNKIMRVISYEKNPYQRLLNQNEIGSIEEEGFKKFAQAQSALIGMIERFVYLLTLQISFFLFIPAWLTLKVSVQWATWKKRIYGRIFFNNFLIGSTINIVLALTGYFSILWINTYQLTDSLLIVIPVYFAILLVPYLLVYLAFRISYKYLLKT